MLSVTNDLVTDQRVHRSCMALTEAGYEVVLVGRMLPESLPLSRPYRTVRMRLLIRKKAAFYAEYNIRLLLRLLFMRADLFFANDTDALPANFVAARLRRKPLFLDAHEMFPEVPELVGRPRVKACWTALENAMFPHIQHCCTVCQSIADIYHERYGMPMKVVRNVPMRTKAPASRPEADEWVRELLLFKGDRRLLLYQGAVNVGRGIEPMLEALPLLDDCCMAVAGIGDKYEELREQVQTMGLENRVKFLGRLPLEQLKMVTLQADLGLSLLADLGLNYYYSLPNRIADFVQSGVPVLATDFPEIHAVVTAYGIGTLVPSGEEDNPKLLAQWVHSALTYWDAMPGEERAERFAKAASELCWEHDKEVLLSAVNECF